MGSDMHAEAIAAMIQRGALQLVNGLNGSTVNPDAVLAHIESMYRLAHDLKIALAPQDAEAEEAAESVN